MWRDGVGSSFLTPEEGLSPTPLASVSSRNEASLAFHQRHGFVERGRLCRIGEKLGGTFDIVWLRRDI